jgi:APA family basic amino acid/polyamine antiporter
MSLFRTKQVAQLIAESADKGGMRRELNAVNLVSLGIGSVIGAGIFVLSGAAAAKYAGPSIALSFVISGVAALLAGLCYAEFSSMIPVAGSAYTYTYATMGELMAWIIGWDLMLEYLFSGAAVAVSWSANAQELLAEFGLTIPDVLARAPWVLEHDHLVASGALVNLPAVFISLLLTVVLVIGIRESARFNNLMVFIKVGVLLVLIAYGTWYLCGHRAIAAANLRPFIPPNTGEFGHYGWSGVFRGAAAIFFAYIGFDAVSTAAQEAKNPQRDMPIGLLACLGICVVLFVGVTLVLTGMVNYTQLNVDAPFIHALTVTGAPAWLRFAVEIASLAGLTSVILISLLGQPRIFFSMASDGLLPASFSRLHPRYKTPHITTWITGIACAITAGLLPLDLLGELISVGTLMAFAVVCVGIIILRKTRPDLPRPFRTPWVPVVPALGALICCGQAVLLPPETWWRLILWMGLGLAVYFAYSVRHSKLRQGPQ